MSIITVWYNENTESVKLMQLSEDPADGTNEEQILYFSTLEAFQGYTCVSQDYTGNVPVDKDPSLWIWNGTEISTRVVIPEVVSPRQVRLVLLQQGLLSQVETMISQLDQASQITWEFAIEFRRNDPLLNSLGQALNLTGEQIDQLFIAASQL